MERQRRRLGKICLLLILTATLLSGCKFFGKEEDPNANRLPGQLEDGTSIVGTWNFSSASPTATNDPQDAVTVTYIFDPNSVLRMEYRDPHANGILCTGYGQYRIVGRDVFAYVQAATPSSCGFAPFTHLGTVRTLPQSLEFTDKDGHKFSYLAARNPGLAPVGLWNFHGDGGIDWILFDVYGYFVLQTTIQGNMYLLIGYYRALGSQLELTFFDNMDPTQVSGSPLIFSEFVTNGNQLSLFEDDGAGGSLLYQGDRL